VTGRARVQSLSNRAFRRKSLLTLTVHLALLIWKASLSRYLCTNCRKIPRDINLKLIKDLIASKLSGSNNTWKCFVPHDDLNKRNKRFVPMSYEFSVQAIHLQITFSDLVFAPTSCRFLVLAVHLQILYNSLGFLIDPWDFWQIPKQPVRTGVFVEWSWMILSAVARSFPTVFDWSCFDYSIRNSLVALLEALFPRLISNVTSSTSWSIYHMVSTANNFLEFLALN